MIIEESGSHEAREIVSSALNSGMEVIAPDIALSESLNVLWKHCFIVKDLKSDELVAAVEDLLALWNGLKECPTCSAAREVIQIASSLSITVYDSIYLAVARFYKSRLFTFDRNLEEAAWKLGISTLPG
ncbi:MAG: type II toxin-antitoxin system VapC family toxin [Candidatus Bathyarchaeia archaeon]